MAGISIRPFTISIPETELLDLRQKLKLVRWPEPETVSDWSQGVPLHVIQDLCEYWHDTYDWRKCENWLNQIGSYVANIDGYEIHFLHIRSHHEDALPMCLMHGWPGSILEFRKVVEPLTNPTKHGGQATDAFHLVIPSMPGYGFSSKPTSTGTNHLRIGALYTRLMESLGYTSWVGQGGDWGADIVAKLASSDEGKTGAPPPPSLLGIHLNCLFFDAEKEIASSDHHPPTPQELEALEKERAFKDVEYGYFKLQATRPQTVGYALADSPVGQAAWIYEKLHTWTQNRGNLEDVLTKDEILDNIMMYWLTNAGASSARLYWEDDDDTAFNIDIPVGVSVFPGELTMAPRMWGERYYANIVYWNDAVEKGGHFAAWEVPDIFVREVRNFSNALRKGTRR